MMADRGAQFESIIWLDLLKTLGIEKAHVCAYQSCIDVGLITLILGGRWLAVGLSQYG